MLSAPHTTNRRLASSFIERHLADGWWPYCVGHDASIEATAWCSLALLDRTPTLQPAMRFLRNSQNEDGGWSTAPGEGPSDWSSSLAVLALDLAAPDGSFDDCIRRGISYLLDHRSDLFDQGTTWLISVLQFLSSARMKRGWSWSPGTFHWVEPTSYAMMALKKARRINSKEIDTAIECATDLLLSNSCDGGGWNYGCPRTLGKPLLPYPVTTAQALLALQHVPEAPVVKSGIQYLSRAAFEDGTAFCLAWAALAMDGHKEDISKYVTSLVALQKPDGSFGRNLLSTAVATCALAAAEGANPLKTTANSRGES